MNHSLYRTQAGSLRRVLVELTMTSSGIGPR
jgi:hypothetical protein